MSSPNAIKTETEDFYYSILAEEKQKNGESVLEPGAARLLEDFLLNLRRIVQDHCAHTNYGIDTRPRDRRNIIRRGDMELSIEHLDPVAVFEEALKTL